MSKSPEDAIDHHSGKPGEPAAFQSFLQEHWGPPKASDNTGSSKSQSGAQTNSAEHAPTKETSSQEKPSAHGKHGEKPSEVTPTGEGLNYQGSLMSPNLTNLFNHSDPSHAGKPADSMNPEDKASDSKPIGSHAPADAPSPAVNPESNPNGSHAPADAPVNPESHPNGSTEPADGLSKGGKSSDSKSIDSPAGQLDASGNKIPDLAIPGATKIPQSSGKDKAGDGSHPYIEFEHESIYHDYSEDRNGQSHSTSDIHHH